MQSIDDLFKFIMQNERTIVYGNLGRRLVLICDYLRKHFPTFEIVMKSKYYKVVSGDHIHINNKTDIKCDLLIYIEPEPEEFIYQPNTAARIIIFSSHLLLNFFKRDRWAFAAYYDLKTSVEEEIENIKKIHSLQQSSRYCDKLDTKLKYYLDFDEVKTISVYSEYYTSNSDIILVPDKIIPNLLTKSVMIVDLTRITSVGAMYVYLLDIIDYLKNNIDMIEYWFICYPNNYNEKFQITINSNIDKLFCMNFKYSNVSLSEIILISPFYKIGTINRNKTCPTNSFCHMKYIAPKTIEEAYILSTMHNLKALTENIYLIID